MKVALKYWDFSILNNKIKIYLIDTVIQQFLNIPDLQEIIDKRQNVFS